MFLSFGNREWTRDMSNDPYGYKEIYDWKYYDYGIKTTLYDNHFELGLEVGMQKAINPIEQISTILPQIAGKNLDDGDQYFAPSKLVITDIRSGMQVTNVTPDKLELMFNVRNSTKTSLPYS